MRTPEQRARSICVIAKAVGKGLPRKHAKNCGECKRVADQIRAAVEAEREKALFDGAAAIVAAVTDAVKAERARCIRRVHEQRCERGTPWDRALLTAVSAIDNDEPVVAIRAKPAQR
jgi:hypothetical protein